MKQFETSSRVCIAYTKDLEVDLVGFAYDFYCAAGFYTTFVYSKLPLCYDLMICEQCASGRNEWIKPWFIFLSKVEKIFFHNNW